MIKSPVIATISALALVTLVGCSSSSEAAAGGEVSAASSSAAASALEALQPYLNDRPRIDLPALSGKPPTGKTINFVSCPLPSCQGIEQGVRAAAAALGWSVEVTNGGITPDTFTSAMNSIAQSPGDAVLAPGILPNSAFQAELDSLRTKGVPFVSIYSSSPVGNGMIANIGADNQVSDSGKVLADWVIADSDAKAKTALFWDGSFPQTKVANDAFIAETSSLCPDCTVDEVSTSFTTGIGTEIPKEVVSYFQRNPDTQYAVFQLGNATSGVGPALAAAGLGDKVKIVSRFADAANFANIEQGTEAMGVTQETYEGGWRMIDVVARFLTNSPLDCCTTPIGVQHVVTSDNLPADITKPYSVPDYESYFTTAWQLD